MEIVDFRTMSPSIKRRQLQSDLSAPYTPPATSSEQLDRMEYYVAEDQVRHYSLRQTSLLFCAVVSDSIILASLVMVTYFLRWTSLVPYTTRTFQCDDPSLNSSINQGYHPLSADESVTVSAVLILCFSVPIVLILISEMLVWAIAGARKPDIHLRLSCCPKVTLFQAARRLYRFVATYLFGAFATIIIVDLLKNVVGQLRPNFLLKCSPRCTQPGKMMTIANCSERNAFVLRDISTSFPSLQSALSMYATVTVLVYLYGISKVHHSKYLITPLITLSVLAAALIASTRQVALYYNWWSDIIAGQVIGAVVAVYLDVLILRCFDLQVYISNRKLMDQILAVEAQLVSLGTANDPKAPRSSIEMCNFKHSRKSSRVFSPPQMNTSNANIPERQVTFDEHSNTFRDDLMRTLSAMNTRQTVNENDEVFYP